MTGPGGMSPEQAVADAVARGLDAGRVLIAVSGGVDSVVLLHAAVSCGADVHVAHVHHGLRGVDADEDAAAAKLQAVQRGNAARSGQKSVSDSAIWQALKTGAAEQLAEIHRTDLANVVLCLKQIGEQ